MQSAGKGAHVIAGTAGYCFGNLHIPGQREPSGRLLPPETRSLTLRLRLQVIPSPGSLRAKAGSIRPASLRPCRWRSRPATEPPITGTSSESRCCRVRERTGRSEPRIHSCSYVLPPSCRFRPFLRHAASRRGAAGMDQADHVQRRPRRHRGRAREEGGSGGR